MQSYEKVLMAVVAMVRQLHKQGNNNGSDKGNTVTAAELWQQHGTATAVAKRWQHSDNDAGKVLLKTEQ